MHRLYMIALAAIGMMSLIAGMLSGTVGTPPVATGGQVAQVEAGASGSPEGWAEDEALMLKRDDTGQFRVDAMVNGASTRFLVDTGADLVAFSEADARALNLPYRDSDFAPILQTASGTGYAAPVRVDQLEVGGQVLRDVDAVVVRDLATNLLGQSVLRRLGAVELQGDSMVIRPR